MYETTESKDKGSKLYHPSQNPDYTTAGLVTGLLFILFYIKCTISILVPHNVVRKHSYN